MDHPVFTVVFLPVGTRVEIGVGATILEAAQRGGVKIRSVCGGVGSCGKCRVIVEEGDVSEKLDPLKKHLTEAQVAKGYHLACQTRILSDLRVTIPAESRIEGQKILSQATLRKVEVSPLAVKMFIDQGLFQTRSLNPEIITNIVSERIPAEIRFSDAARERLLELGERAAEGVTVSLSKFGEAFEVIDLELGDTSNRFYGLAVDVGTTKVVIYLVNLRTGDVVDANGGYNEQLAYGEDLLSRIDYAHRHVKGVSQLQEAAIRTIKTALEPLLSRNTVESRQIVDVSVAGNTVMTYLLAGLDPSDLVDADVRVSRHPIRQRSKDLGFSTNAMARVYMLPNVSRFLGGDAVADVLSAGLHQSDEMSILIDMGTNGEIVIGSQGWLLSTSCAAGPAFEGWEIQHGMRSVEGAIEHVEIDKRTLRASYTVIGGATQKPRGLCGSGIIDAVAEMFRVGIVDFTGKIQDHEASPLIRTANEHSEYVVVPVEETDIGRDVVITQKDITNLLDSKAAVCGATAVLMRKINADITGIQKLYLAGAFGTYVDPQKATQLGIFPEFPNVKIEQIGNGAIAGAYLALISQKKRREAEEIADLMTYYDLTADPDFMDEYSAALYIPGRRELFPTMNR